ncbi:MAG: glycosyltransferase [Candidatus Pacearchaeota archaeon]
MEKITFVYLVMFFFGNFFLTMFLILYYRNRKTLFDYPTATKFPSITILVPAYNEENSITGTIEALINLKYPEGKKKIIVVNDGSTDKTSEIVKGFMKKNKEIRLLDKPNSGKANSLNQALEIVDTELFAVVDADSYPEPEALLKMVGYFEEDEKIAAVTSRVLVKNTTNFIEKFQAVDYAIIAWGRKILDYVDSVYVTNGPLSVYNTRYVKEVGCFDPKNLTEDIELTWNLLNSGYKTKMSYSALVYTSVPSRLKQWIRQRIRWNLGGLQTIQKYKSAAFKGENIFGYFVVTYVTLSFLLAIIGFALIIRYLWIKFYFYFNSLPYIFQGYDFINFLDFGFGIGLIFIMGAMFFILSFSYYRISLYNDNLKSKGILTILIYLLIYRPLYTIPLISALYKIAKRDIRWYTK